MRTTWAIRRGASMLVSLAMLACASAAAATPDPDDGGYASLSLEELMEVNVTTVAGTPEPRFTTPAALTVISGDDIRRAGHRSIAEALRMVPGMYVARINNSGYTVGTRGLVGNSITSNRYLVLIDGRVAQDPLISVTLWDVADIAIEDIERIEVIRGPGATLWGANATNGVINVISRSASDTQGTLLSLGPGDSESIATLRQGFRVGKTAMRAYAKYADHSRFELFTGAPAHDAYSTVRAGFRADHVQSAQTTWTLDTNLYQLPTADVSVRLPVPGAHAQFVRDRTSDDVSGGHLLARVQRELSPRSGFSIQTYYDRVNRDTTRIGIHRRTLDLDLRHWTRWSERNELVWGAQFTQHDDDLTNKATFSFEPASRQWNIFNAFAQNTSTLIDERLFLMLGSKFSHHEFAGSFVQPGARLWWTPSERQTLWAAVSRPVRVPSRLEEDGFIILAYADTGLAAGMEPSGVIVPLGVGGDDELRVEELMAYELGHRYRVGERLALDVAVFYNDYRRLIGIPTGIFGSFVDSGRGETYGGEISASYKPAPAWQLEASYAHLDTAVRGPILRFDEDNTPGRLAQLRASWKLRSDLEFNSALYYVSRAIETGIDAYTRADAGLSWALRPGIQLSLWGQNLTDPGHREASAVEIPRSFYAQLRLEL